jgi:polysaccharide export outer membrane protein
MRMSQHWGFIWKIVVVVLVCAVVLAPGWAQGRRTKAVPAELALNVPSKDPGIPVTVVDLNSASIEKIQAIDLGRQVQVRVVGSGALSCSPFLLAAPDRLVLDCTGAHVRAGMIPSRVNIDPVVSVRAGQFNTHVARVVVELTGQTPYTVDANGKEVLVTFDLSNRRSPSLPSESKPSDSPVSLVNVQADQVASAPVPAVRDKLPVPERPQFSPAGFIPAGALPPYPSPSTPVPAQQVPEITSGPVGVPRTVAGVDAMAAKLELILPDQDYVIGPQDLLAIDVWHEPELSQTVPVRPDGKISLPLIGELEVSGLTPRALQGLLAKELEAYIHKPQVTAIVREVNSRKYFLIGEVERPGSYPLSPHMTVLDALATAGGFRDFAKIQQIYLLRLRPDGSRNRLHFDYKAAVNGKAWYRDIELQMGDTLIVP